MMFRLGFIKYLELCFRYINRYWKGVSYKYLYNIYIHVNVIFLGLKLNFKLINNSKNISIN